MTKRTPASGKTGFLFSMLLFFVFLFCSVFTVLIGSRVYENIRERDNDSFYRDTAVSYVVNKIRQADQSGGVTVGETDDGTTFLLLRRAGRKTPFNHLPGSFQRRFPGEYKKRLSSSSKRFRRISSPGIFRDNRRDADRDGSLPGLLLSGRQPGRSPGQGFFLSGRSEGEHGRG